MYCRSLNIESFETKYSNRNDFYEAIALAYIDSLKPQKNDFDYGAYLQNQTRRPQTYQSSKDMIEPLTEWIGDRMPVMSSKSMSIYMDSRVRGINDSENDITKFLFGLAPRQTKAELGDGRIQVREMPSHITYFKLGKIILPYTQEMQLRNFTKEMTLTFTALRSNGIIGREDTYHFAFTYGVNQSNPDMIELTPVNKYCKFSPPLRIVDDVSIQFNDPLYPVSFKLDRMIPSSFNYLSSDGRIQFTKDHNLNTNDVVIIQGFKTNNDAVNRTLLKMINDPRGLVVTKINNTTISINVDFTKIISPDISSLPIIIFYSKTFRFPLEIGYQDITHID